MQSEVRRLQLPISSVGERWIWLETAVVQRLKALRGPGDIRAVGYIVNESLGRGGLVRPFIQVGLRPGDACVDGLLILPLTMSRYRHWSGVSGGR